MLRRLEIKSTHRSLAPGFWSNAIPFGKRTIIYGHNGSGKSTLSHLLLEIANGSSPVEATWHGDDGTSKKVPAGGGLAGGSMAVFTKDWVERNLSAFLEGSSASAIVTLGEEAIGAKEEEERLEGEIAQFVKDEKEAGKTQGELKRKLEGLAGEGRDAISDQLQEFDYKRFTKNKWSVPTMKTRLTDYKGDFPSASEYADALKRLGEGALTPTGEVSAPPVGIGDILEHLTSLLEETPTRVAIAQLESHPSAQTWVEQGIALHEGEDACLFCSGPITEARREQLGKHFDESWLNIRERATALVNQLDAYKTGLSTWLTGLPETDVLASELQSTYASQVKALTEDVDARLIILKKVADVARAKRDDPSATPTLPDVAALEKPFTTSALMGAVKEHNEQAEAQTERTERHYTTVLDHLIGSRSTAYRDMVVKLGEAETKHSDARDALRLARTALDEVKQKQLTSHKMAETLTADLARVYGKHHLSVSVTSDGKSYACKRGDQPATNLSTGERTTLSLLYFLRKLEDESESTDASERIVVVDDPSSSLDREAVFATHQWLIDTLRPFGQYVVLTHDFSLLRLFIKSQTSQWGKSVGAKNKGDKAEIMFPRVAFLEMYAASEGEGRTTKIAELPKMLKENTSEYAYLFSMVMQGVREGADADQLFLLPNAARRLLEVFCSFKVPHRSNFDDQLKELVGGESAPEPYRDVYDFCQRRSHGEGGEVVDVLDARAVHGHIRRCMEFLKYADQEHFERMCKAVKCEETLI